MKVAPSPADPPGHQPRLYTDLADWYHLLTAPSEYGEEAAFFMRLIADAAGAAPMTLLELGSVSLEHSDVPLGSVEVFVAIRPAS